MALMQFLPPSRVHLNHCSPSWHASPVCDTSFLIASHHPLPSAPFNQKLLLSEHNIWLRAQGEEWERSRLRNKYPTLRVPYKYDIQSVSSPRLPCSVQPPSSSSDQSKYLNSTVCETTIFTQGTSWRVGEVRTEEYRSRRFHKPSAQT